MVIDDDSVTLELIGARLSAAGYEVQTREEALGTSEAVREFQPDVVVVDVHMPGLSGDRLAPLLQEMPGAPKLVFHSSMDEGKLADLSALSGAAGYIKKSPGAQRFVERLEAAIDRR